LHTVSREQLIAQLRDRSRPVVDVMSPEAFAAEHIPGSVSLPVDEIEKKGRSLFPDLAREITVYCGGPT
jgi:rhodanese-related sulfurtransferase